MVNKLTVLILTNSVLYLQNINSYLSQNKKLLPKLRHFAKLNGSPLKRLAVYYVVYYAGRNSRTFMLYIHTYIHTVCDQVQAKYNINSATSADLTEQMKSRAEKQTPRELVILPRLLMLTPLNSTLASTDSTSARSLTHCRCSSVCIPSLSPHPLATASLHSDWLKSGTA